MNKVARKLSNHLSLQLGNWERTKSHILGEASISRARTSLTDPEDSPTGLCRRRLRNRLGAATMAAVVGGVLAYMQSAVAQAPPLTFEVLAGGFTSDRVRINAKGPSDVLQTKIVIQPGADTGWHSHPGAVIVVVKTGALTEFHGNGCVSVHPAGSVFLESEGEVHRVINESSVTSESYATFIIPPGSQPLQPAADPANVVCGSGGNRQH